MPTIPFLNLGLGDLAKITSDAYNAKALGEYEAEKRQREDDELKDRRRREALERALLEVNTDRRREELRRLRAGQPPTPPSNPTSDRPPVVGLGTRDFDEYLDRYGQVTDAAVERTERTTEARERVQSRFDTDDPNEPPSLNQIQDVSDEMVRAVLAGNPRATPDEVVSLATSEEGIASLSPPIRLLVEGGRITETSLRSAYHRVRRSQLERDAEFQSIIDDIDNACSVGASLDEIERSVERNPNFSRYEDAIYAHIDSLNCG